ncbi:hypothetical protein LBMAG53_26000 [Planctomycetota bacterium]|nr:hypothetical protein LBMAG53_26000 [Planctomycetota bacterium]
MGLPLQPDLHPAPPWWWRMVTLLVVTLAVLVAAILAGPQRAAVLVVGVDADAAPYAVVATERIRSARTRLDLVMFAAWMDGDRPHPLAVELAAAASRGVAVTVCLDFDGKDTDDRNAPLASWMAAHGITLIRDEPDRRTHAKVLVCDRRWVLLGSHNWTRTGVHANRELAVLLDDPEKAEEILAWCARIPGWK